MIECVGGRHRRTTLRLRLALSPSDRRLPMMTFSIVGAAGVALTVIALVLWWHEVAPERRGLRADSVGVNTFSTGRGGTTEVVNFVSATWQHVRFRQWDLLRR